MSAPPAPAERTLGPAPPARRRALAWVIGGLAIVTSGLGLVGYWGPASGHALLALAVLAPYLMTAAPAAAVVLLLMRRWVVFGLTLAVAGVCLALLVPRWWPARADVAGPAVRVMTANLRLGDADPAALVRTVRARHIDVLLVQELTGAEVTRLHAAGLDALLPGHEVDARNLASGAGLWTRFPIADARRIGGYVFAMVAARLVVPGSAADLVVASLHMPGPWPQPVQAWAHDLALLPGTLHALSTAVGGPVVVGGDFNATVDVRPFRALLRDGYADAAGQAGGGLMRTFPADGPFPALIDLDHVLVRRARATSASTVTVRGSDHRGVITRIVLTP